MAVVYPEMCDRRVEPPRSADLVSANSLASSKPMAPSPVRWRVLAATISLVFHILLMAVLALFSFGSPATIDRRLLLEMDTELSPRLDVVANSTPTIETEPLVGNRGGRGGSRGAELSPILNLSASQNSLGQALAGSASLNQPGDLTGGLGTGGGTGFGAGESEFFGVAAQGNKIVYVIDRSQSMRQNDSIQLAKIELQKSLDLLSETMRFQVVFYNSEAKLLLSSKDLLLASARNLEAARLEIDQLQAQGGTDHEKALRLAMNLSADVIYLLTDAETHETDATAFARIRSLNEQQKRRGKPASIHVIHFFHTFNNPNPIVRKFAEDNNGAYRVIATKKQGAE